MISLWDLAKSRAREEDRANDWAYILQTYKDSGGMEKSIQLCVDGASYELLGEGENHLPLVRNDITNDTFEMAYSKYVSARKLFKSVSGVPRKGNSSLIAVKKQVTRKDGTTFMQTFYVSPEEKKELEPQKVETEYE